MADIAGGYAALTVAAEDAEVTTGEYKINFMAGFKDGELRALGRVNCGCGEGGECEQRGAENETAQRDEACCSRQHGLVEQRHTANHSCGVY